MHDNKLKVKINLKSDYDIKLNIRTRIKQYLKRNER